MASVWGQHIKWCLLQANPAETCLAIKRHTFQTLFDQLISWWTDIIFFGLIVTKFETAKQPIEILGLLIQNRITFSIQGQTRIWETPVVVYLTSKRRRNRRSRDIKCLMLMILIVNPFCMMTQTGNKWRLISAVCFMYSKLTYDLTMLLSHIGLWKTITHCRQYSVQYFAAHFSPQWIL